MPRDDDEEEEEEKQHILERLNQNDGFFFVFMLTKNCSLVVFFSNWMDEWNGKIMKNLITPKQLHTNQNEIMPLIITKASVDCWCLCFFFTRFTFCRDQPKHKKEAAAAAAAQNVEYAVTNPNGKKSGMKSPVHSVAKADEDDDGKNIKAYTGS